MKKQGENIPMYLYSVEVEALREGGYFASCPALQGCHAEGDTYAAALQNIEDMIREHARIRKERGDPLPSIIIDKRERAVVTMPFLVPA